MNLKAAIDMVNKKGLIRALKERGLRESLVKRYGDLYKKTRIRIRARKELGNGFRRRGK